MQDVYELLLNKIDTEYIKLNEPMSNHTSFRIGGPADIFVKVWTISELKYVLDVAKTSGLPVTIVR
ncbi:MAG: hypothetical protein FWC79_00215 [Oscillospiraceae bacterium]|nr:hypothetical protein [Oscillospiraceae bacterium]